MNLLEVLFLAIALSIDAFIVSFSYGLCIDKNRRKNALTLAFFVGFFQFLMPLVGGLLAKLIYSYIENFAQPIAGSIFVLLGLKFLYDSIFKKEDPESCDISKTSISWQTILLLSVATSIDALAAGGSLYFLKTPILIPAIIIGIITFINSLIGFTLGHILKHIAPKPLEIIGAIILIFIGVKTFTM